MNLVWKLLKENISKAQLIGFFAANLIGMTIVLVAIQFYSDINPIFTQKDDLFKRDFFTITKKVSILNTFASGASGFTPDEINELRNSGFVKDLGIFVPSRFGVYAGINQKGVRFGTEMFFESIPDKFIDVKSNDWRFSPVDNTIPIILPKNYLDLYNFGFAESQEMPKITEGMIGVVPLDVTIFGQGQRKQMKGRIVGLSNRINTILVPSTFMEWANQNYGNEKNANASRLILEIDNITDTRIAEFLKEKGYEVEGENVAISRMSSFLKILVGIVITVGTIICILSFIILVLSIYLLLEKNMQKLQKLRLLGYARLRVTAPYERLVVIMNASILLLSVIFMLLIKLQYTAIVSKVWSNFESRSIVPTILIGVSVSCLLSAFNIYIIRRKVK
ncbi:ABC transporter permease [Dysgonomonas sp. 216]|uniref:ABC transporter permease n=1 Tax=Dysgonomonas sp. 216 TaxID=2302934 RepID=UPI0013D86CF4|nr:ABC transporter permease [Dysgonomonas sp. 216]NDW19151.1 ABC transporter permease [Dysgonomonas sp. 216]